MFDKMINEVLNPTYENLNAVDALMNSKWAIISYIKKVFTEKGWSIDSKDVIHGLRQSQSNGNAGVFPNIDVVTPNGESFSFILLFTQKESVLQNRLEFKLMLPNKKTRKGFVPSIRTLTISTFAASLFNEINKLYTNEDHSEIVNDLGFNASPKGKPWEILNRIYPGVRIEIEQRYGISLIFNLVNGDDDIDYIEIDNKKANGNLYDSIWSEIYCINSEVMGGSGISQVNTFCNKWNDMNDSERLFFYPEQKQELVKIINLVFSDKVFEKYFKQYFKGAKYTSDVEIEPHIQRVSISFSKDSGGSPIEYLKNLIKEDLIKKVSKYGAKYKNRKVSGDCLRQKFIIKAMLQFHIKDITEEGKESLDHIAFYARQL